jgi:hypothetical protein
MLVFYFLCYFLIFNFCFSYQVLIFGHPEIVDHLFSCNGCQPVPRDCLIKICGVKLITKDTILLAVLCEDCHVEILSS